MAGGDSRAALEELAQALRVLHRRLLAATQAEFEKVYGRVEGPGALLQLLINDPLFAWLRPVSQQMAALDELAADEVDAAVVEAARKAVARVIDEPSDFRATYLVYLQADPDIVIAHAALRRLAPLIPRDRPNEAD
jgi:hypothetical protein